MPTPEEIEREGIADEAWWRQRALESVELAMHVQRSLPMHRARRVWPGPVARVALHGVVFHIDGHGLAWSMAIGS